MISYAEFSAHKYKYSRIQNLGSFFCLILAHDLAGSDQGGFNDPYVRLTLTPEIDSRKRQTTIHRNDPNPLFDQHFKFPISHEELQTKTLVLQVFDYDRFSRNDVIGEVRMSMEDFDVTSNIEVWGEITKNKKPPEELQEILLSLSYLPSAERLTVVLLKARNLFLPAEKENIGKKPKQVLHLNLFSIFVLAEVQQHFSYQRRSTINNTLLVTFVLKKLKTKNQYNSIAILLIAINK